MSYGERVRHTWNVNLRVVSRTYIRWRGGTWGSPSRLPPSSSRTTKAHPTPYTLHFTPYTLAPSPCTLHPEPHDLHLTPPSFTDLSNMIHGAVSPTPTPDTTRAARCGQHWRVLLVPDVLIRKKNWVDCLICADFARQRQYPKQRPPRNDRRSRGRGARGCIAAAGRPLNPKLYTLHLNSEP